MKPLDLSNDIRIKKIPFKCVVCNGFGTISYGKKLCHACDGKGYILVDQEKNEMV